MHNNKNVTHRAHMLSPLENGKKKSSRRAIHNADHESGEGIFSAKSCTHGWAEDLWSKLFGETAA